LDDLDHRLIAALRVDGRASLSELAKRLGVSRGTVQNRIDRLVESGVILGFTVRVKDIAASGRIRAIMMLEVAGKSTRSVIQALRGLPEIHALHSTNGAFDLIAEIDVESLAEFDRVLSRVRTIEGVSRSETSLLLAPA
jgi:DNA-binding Lrp family transcriptional regulator